MKKFFFLLCYILFLQNQSIGQELFCGTISELEDDNITQELNTIKYLRSTNEYSDSDTLHFRLQIHIIRNSNHYTDLNLDSLKKDLEDLNLYYASAGIQFYQCSDIDYIDNDTFYIFYSANENALRNTYNDPFSINIYFAHSVHSGTSSVAGYSYLPSSSRNFIIIANDYLRLKTLPHEVGHFFNLLHTHDTRYGHELVNGSNCSTAGDLCCDTPADPGLSSSNVNSNCLYTGTITDANGDLYTPDVHNIMSYARKQCRNIFSSEQYERIRNAAYLSNRIPLCSHFTLLTNDSLTTNTIIENDYITIDNYYLSGDSIKIKACQNVLLRKSITIEKGVQIN